MGCAYGCTKPAASPVEYCAGELKAHILALVAESGCGKVNIIAHSKGGLDARYAVSRLGMDGYVASLTTVNTPHPGCRFAKKALDNVPGVLYQSVGSKMKNSRSAVFPLSLGHQTADTVDKAENDGLAAVGSMPWGDFTMLHPSGKRDISHADAIDLTQKDIRGFDVCEFYVGLVQRLKKRGL